MIVNKAQSFGGYTNIKTKSPSILNSLEDFDFDFLRKQNNPTCRYSHVAQSGPGKDGFFQGVLQDNEDAKKPLKYADFGEKVIIEKFEDLEKIPSLKQLMPKLKKYYDNLTKS